MSAAKKLARRGIDEKGLRKLIPLNTLGVESLRELVYKANVEQFPPQRTIFNVGDQDNRTYYLLSGEVEVRLPSGQNISIKADTPAALHPISDTRPRQATVVTRTHSNLLCIDRNLLEILVSNGKQDGYQVTEIQSEYQSDWMTRFLQSLSAINVPVKNIENLMQTMEEIPVSAGDTVIRQSDRDAQHYYVLKEGRCVVTKQTGSGKTPIRVAEISEGIGFGEEALLANQPRSATVTMLTDGRLVRWRKPDFARFIAEPALQVVDYAEAERLIASGAVWIDTRSEQEFRRNGLPGAVNVPLTALRLKCRELNVYGKYVAYCDDGHRAAAAAFVLRQLGYPVSVLQNGLSAIPASKSVNAAAMPPPAAPAVELKSQARSAETGVESERQAANEALQRAQNELATLRSQMQSAQDAEAAANQRLPQVKGGAERETEQARAQVTALQRRMALLEQDHAGKERELVRLRLELEEARWKSQEEAQRASANIAAQSKSRIAEAQEEARLARQQANDYALNLAATEAAHAAAQNDIQQLRSELERLRTELREEQAQLAKTREAQASELNGMKQNLDRETERKRAAEEALKAAERETARLKAEADAARRQAEELARRARESESQHATMLEEIKRQAAAAEAQRREAEEQARRLKEAAEASRRKAEEEARRLAEAETARLKAVEESEKRARLAEEIRRKADEEIARAKAESEAARRAAADARSKPQPRMTDSQASRVATPLSPRTKSPDESQELADIEQELARLQQKLESKKRAAVSRQEEIERKTDPNETSELTQNVYDISQKTQKLPAFKPNQGPPTNVGKVRKSGWVSDAILWETTLGMREDAEAEKILSDAPSEPQKKSPPVHHQASGEIRTSPHSHSASQPPARAMASGEMRTDSRRPLFTAHDPAPIASVRRDDPPKRGNNNLTLIIAVAIAALAGGGIALVVSDRFSASQDAAPVTIGKPVESVAPLREPTPVDAPAPEASTGTIQRNSAPATKPATPAPTKTRTASPAPSKAAATTPEIAPAVPGSTAASSVTTKAAVPEPAPQVAPAASAAVEQPDPATNAAASLPPTASPAASPAAPPATDVPAEDTKPAIREFSDKAEVH